MMHVFWVVCLLDLLAKCRPNAVKIALLVFVGWLNNGPRAFACTPTTAVRLLFFRSAFNLSVYLLVQTNAQGFTQQANEAALIHTQMFIHERGAYV